MATFSQQFLANLGRPQITGGMMELGAALGKLPQQQQLSKIDTNTPEGLLQLANFYKAQGDIDNAVKYEEAARQLTRETKALTNIEGLRASIITRAGGIKGLENLATTAETATPQQLESMRQTVLEAEQAKQLKTEQITQANAAAESMGFDTNFINVFAEDPEGLINVVRSVAEAKSINAVKTQSEAAANAVLVKRAESYDAPSELIQDIKEGLYTGKPLEALSAMRGEDSKNESYQNSETGEIFMLATKGAKVFKDGKWALPSKLGLIAAPKVTAEGSIPKFKTEMRNVPSLALAAGSLNRFVDELDSFSDLQTDMLVSGLSPFTTDSTEALESYRGFVVNSLERFFSGAAVPKFEHERYNKLLVLTGSDIFSPKSIAHKVIAAAALTNINAKLAAGEISSVEARTQAYEAGTMSLSEEDYELIKEGKTGSLRKVIKKYTDDLLDTGSGSKADPVNSILSKYNF